MKAKKSDVIVIAAAKAKPGKEAALEQALRAVAAPTRAQPGSVEFTLFRAVEAPGTLVGFERWASAADHQRHLKGAHVATLMERMEELLGEPPNIVAYEMLDEG